MTSMEVSYATVSVVVSHLCSALAIPFDVGVTKLTLICCAVDYGQVLCLQVGHLAQ